MGNDIGVIILGTAVLVLMGWGLRGFFTDAEIHLGLRVAVGVIGGGILFLVVRLVKAVKGNTIRARHVGRDIRAGLKGLVGGEITDYTQMMSDAREEAVRRMVADAEKKGANAVISMRFATSMIIANAAEVLAYGTAVVLE